MTRAEEGILYADLDLEVGIKMKLRHDFAGPYNRPDVFQVRVKGDGAPALDQPAQHYLEEARDRLELTEGE